MIPRDTYEGAFYRAVLALHMDQFQLAQQVNDFESTEVKKQACRRYSDRMCDI